METESHRYAKGREFTIRRKVQDATAAAGNTPGHPDSGGNPPRADSQSVISGGSSRRSNKSSESKLSNWLFSKSGAAGSSSLEKDLVLRCDTPEVGGGCGIGVLGCICVCIGPIVVDGAANEGAGTGAIVLLHVCICVHLCICEPK